MIFVYIRTLITNTRTRIRIRTRTHTHTHTPNAGFSSPLRLALNGLIAAAVNKTVREHRPLPEGASVGVWGGEIGPHNGGSPVCDHTSMRWAVFGDSMWYVWGWVRGALSGYGAITTVGSRGKHWG